MASPETTSYRLNLFQQAMALWEERHPYNAAYVVRLRDRADVERLRHAIQAACRQAGVGRLVLDRRRRRYHYEPADAIDLAELGGGESARATVDRIVSEELSAPFPAEPHHPVRWKVVDDPETTSHFVLATFRHVAADEVAMRLLVGRVLDHYLVDRPRSEEPPLRVHPPHGARVMRHHHRRLGYLVTLGRAVRLYARLRHVHRLPEVDGRDGRSRAFLFEAPDGLIDRLSAACRQRGVTVTDAYLAALGGALAELTPERLRHPRRRGLALGVVADIRGAASVDLSACFGLYLGQSIVVIDAPEPADLPGLLRGVAETMRTERTEKRFAGVPWNFLMLTLLRRWFSFEGTRAWYRKIYPISAGLSSIKVDGAGFRGANDRILDCAVLASTGPVFPLLFILTTFRDKLRLGVTYAESVFTHREVGHLVQRFLARLEVLGGATSAATAGGAGGA